MSNFVDVAAEVRVLAGCIDRPELILQLTDILFTGDRKDVFQHLLACFMRFGTISSEGYKLISGKDLNVEYDISRGAIIRPIIDHLVACATRRELVTVQNNINNLVIQPEISNSDVTKILAIPPILVESDTALSSGALEFVSDFQRKREGNYVFVDPGLEFLRYMLGGEWPRQGLTVILGEGGSGKTTLVGTSMLEMARDGLGSFMASLEMTKSRLISRLVANVASVNNLSLRNGNVTDEEQMRIDSALGEITGLPMYIDDRPGMGISDIIDQIRVHKERYGIHAVFVDYLQIIGSTKTHEDTSELYAYYAQQLRNAAVRYDVAVVTLAQQNRGGSGLASILGSGKVGHIADVVLELKNSDNPSAEVRPVTIDVHKNRDGPLGSQTATLEGKYLRFL